MGKRQRPFLPYSSFATPEANATLFSSLANRGGSVRLASNRRIDVPENVGGPASCGNAERSGPHQDLRPLATPAGVGERLPHEDMGPGTGEIDETPQVDAGPEPAQRDAQRGPGADDDPERLGGGPARRGGPHPCVDAGEHAPTVEDGRKGESSNAIQQDELSRQPGEGVYNP